MTLSINGVDFNEFPKAPQFEEPLPDLIRTSEEHDTNAKKSVFNFLVKQQKQSLEVSHNQRNNVTKAVMKGKELASARGKLDSEDVFPMTVIEPETNSHMTIIFSHEHGHFMIEKCNKKSFEEVPYRDPERGKLTRLFFIIDICHLLNFVVNRLQC